VRRRQWAAWPLVGAVVLLLATRPEAAGQSGLGGRVEVRQVETGFRLGGDGLRLRVYLVSGQAVEYETRDQAEIERILGFVRIFSGSNRSRLFAELEGNALKGLQVSVP
jgi:hypothetical protein